MEVLDRVIPLPDIELQKLYALLVELEEEKTWPTLSRLREGPASTRTGNR